MNSTMLSFHQRFKNRDFCSLGPFPIAAIALGLLLLASPKLHAQDPCRWAVQVKHLVVKSFLNAADQPLSYLLEEGVPLRDCPDTSCEVLARLPIGLGVYLLEESKDSLVRRGIESKWYRVEADGRSGWVWGGSVAQYAFGSCSDPSVKFVAGLVFQSNVSEHHCSSVLAVRALRNGVVIDTIVVPCPSWEFDGVSSCGDRGLREPAELIAVGVACTGGCGCSGGDLLYAWTGTKFIHMIDLMGVADGKFSEGKHLIFPSDMEGLPHQVILVNRGYNDTDELREQNMMERVNTYSYWRWDGKRLVATGRETITKRCMVHEDF